MHNRYFLHEECSVIHNGKRRNARIINVEYNGNEELVKAENEECASITLLLHLRNAPRRNRQPEESEKKEKHVWKPPIVPNPDDFSYDVELLGDDGMDDVQDDEMLVEGVKHTLLSYVTAWYHFLEVKYSLRRDKSLVNKVRMRLFLRKHLVPHVDKYIVKVKKHLQRTK